MEPEKVPGVVRDGQGAHPFKSIKKESATQAVDWRGNKTANFKNSPKIPD